MNINKKNYSYLKKNILLPSVFICMVGFLAFCLCRPSRMSEERAVAAFKQYVLSPIPASVTDIRADQPKNWGGYRFTFRFKISRDDLSTFVKSRELVRVWNTKYEHGRLSWHWDRDGLFGTGKYGSGIPCYDHTRAPRWFKPERWDNPEAYALYRIGDHVNIETFAKNVRGPTNIRVLLYNEKETEAYFVVTYWEH